MKNRKFDCVEMKAAAQRACREAYGDLPFRERRKKMIAMIMDDPVLADIYRTTYRPDGTCGATATEVSCVAEMEPKYDAKR